MTIVAEHIYFGSPRKFILNDINLVVKEAEIVGLIGPSGSGKTSFLKIIIGLSKPKSGEILVFGYVPGSKKSGIPGTGVGYMPQELALQNNLTIGEIFWYYGKLYCLSDELIEQETAYFANTLSLPEKTRLIANMSGGQKRRLSFAIALMHRPKLLIIDEPTADVDPIVCKVMWNELIHFAKNNGSSIIITTHYFSEARRADTIAFLRKGQILEKGPPEVLLNQYELKTIDELFVILSKKQQQNFYRKRNCEFDQKPMKIEELRRKSCAEEFERVQTLKAMRAKILAIIWKYLIQTRRNPLAMLMFFVFSFFTIYTFLSVVGKCPKDIPVAWVVDEPLPKLSNDSLLNVSNDIEKSSIHLPTIFKSMVNSEIIELKDYSSLSEAYESLKEGDLLAVVYFGPNFSVCYLLSDPMFNNEWVDDETLNNGSIYIKLIESNSILTNTVELVIQQAYLKFRQKVASLLDINPLVIEPFIKIEDEIFDIESDEIFGFNKSFVPITILYICFCLTLIFSSVSMSMEMRDDAISRSLVAGVTLFQVIISQVVAINIFATIGMFINFFGSLWIKDVDYPGKSLFLTLFLLWLQMLAANILGALLGALIKDTLFNFFIAFFTSIYAFTTNEIFKSLLAQPYYIKWLSEYQPMTGSVKAMRFLMNGENSISHPLIWPSFVSSICWIILPFIFCFMYLKLRA